MRRDRHAIKTRTRAKESQPWCLVGRRVSPLILPGCSYTRHGVNRYRDNRSIDLLFAGWPCFGVNKKFFVVAGVEPVSVLTSFWFHTGFGRHIGGKKVTFVVVVCVFGMISIFQLEKKQLLQFYGCFGMFSPVEQK